jgi:hypothetical protein
MPIKRQRNFWSSLWRPKPTSSTIQIHDATVLPPYVIRGGKLSASSTFLYVEILPWQSADKRRIESMNESSSSTVVRVSAGTVVYQVPPMMEDDGRESSEETTTHNSTICYHLINQSTINLQHGCK